MSIKINNLSYVYMPKSPFERTALKEVSLEIPEGEITAIAGHTGSGKSTLIQHFNGLLQATTGEVLVDGINITAKTKEARNARRSVGMVFQYPEHQLFEETVAKDVAFGPANYGVSEEEIQQRVHEALDFVDLPYEEFANRSPFQLSGGQMRRAAIAGVLALKTKYLILDEPTAGLDPRGKEDLLQKIVQLHRETKNTIVLVSHNMDDIARFADNLFVMKQGQVVLSGLPGEVFAQREEIRSAGLDIPQISAIVEKLQQQGWNLGNDIYTVPQGVQEIFKILRRKEKC